MSTSFTEQARQIAPLIEGLRREVEDWAHARSDKPRPASMKSLRKLETLLTHKRSAQLAEEITAKARFLRESGSTIYPKTLRERIVWVAVNIWGFR